MRNGRDEFRSHTSSVSVDVSFGSAPTDSSAATHVLWPTVVNREETVTWYDIHNKIHTQRGRDLYIVQLRNKHVHKAMQCLYKGKQEHVLVTTLKCGT